MYCIYCRNVDILALKFIYFHMLVIHIGGDQLAN